MLERRLASYTEMSVSSRTAQREVGKAERQLALLDALVERRDALIETCRHENPGTGEITAAAERVEHALTEARTGIGDAAEPLRRTRSRGVYRSPSGEFVVLAYDSAGIEHRHHHAAREAARTHAQAVRLSEEGVGAASHGYLNTSETLGSNWTGGGTSGSG